MNRALHEALVELLRYNIDGTQRLNREHAPDAKGRCAVCRSIGCTIYAATREALRRVG